MSVTKTCISWTLPLDKVSEFETLSPVGDIHCRKDFQLVQKYLTVFKAIYINDRWVTFKANTGAADTTANHRFGKYIRGWQRGRRGQDQSLWFQIIPSLLPNCPSTPYSPPPPPQIDFFSSFLGSHGSHCCCPGSRCDNLTLVRIAGAHISYIIALRTRWIVLEWNWEWNFYVNFKYLYTRNSLYTVWRWAITIRAVSIAPIWEESIKPTRWTPPKASKSRRSRDQRGLFGGKTGARQVLRGCLTVCYCVLQCISVCYCVSVLLFSVTGVLR